ncbi:MULTISPECIES: YjcQ family protein [Paenibacillus]|uniref:YjcQ family protein n=1 Tax=Paenibacillus TaxID=44249 RepID=UPI003F89A149
MSKKATDIIFTILNRLEEAMDEGSFDLRELSSDVLGISEAKRIAILEIMLDEDLMTGISIKRGPQGDIIINGNSPRITMAGLKYLSDNSATSKVINAAKFLKDVIPGL